MNRKVFPISLLLVLAMLAPALADKKKKKDDHVHEVSIKDQKFDPEELKIPVGDTVVWTNNDDRDHTVTSKDFKSGKLSKGDTFEQKFSKADRKSVV